MPPPPNNLIRDALTQSSIEICCYSGRRRSTYAPHNARTAGFPMTANISNQPNSDLRSGVSQEASGQASLDQASTLEFSARAEMDNAEMDNLELNPDVDNSGLDPLEAGITLHTEKLPDRQRRIVAHTEVPLSAEQLWQVLTDYDNLSSFIPNLTHSQRLSHPEGGIRLEQVGAQCFLNVKFCARVVLDMVETFPRELSFAMVEGDFRKFEGKWTLEPVIEQPSPITRLGYDLVIRPPRAMPAGIIERHIRHDLSRNLRAISDHAIALFNG